LLNMG